MPRSLTLIARCLLLTLSLLAGSLHAEPRVTVYAAASLTDAMNALIGTYEAANPVDLVPVYASSSTLARQIANGAPADLYLSANEKWMDWLGEQAIRLTGRTDLLQNRLALIAPLDSPVEQFVPGSGVQLVSLLKSDERLSVGDPDHVPAGIYAKQALQHLGEWNILKDRLARGDNVRAALALVERGETPLGIVYQTDAQASDAVRQLGLFPEGSHKTITYPVALVSSSSGQTANIRATEAFRDWLAGDTARAIFIRFGFSPMATATH